MSRRWGAILVALGLFLVLFPWLSRHFRFLPHYLESLIMFVSSNEAIFERLLPLSLILLGFAILAKGFLRKVLILVAFAVALLSMIAIILPSNGFSPNVSEKKIEFFVGDMIVGWKENEQKSWNGWKGTLNGMKVVEVNGNRVDVEFFVGNVKVFLPDDKDVSVNVKGGIGEIDIFAPENVRVEAEGNLGIGNFRNNHVPVNSEHTARISYELGIGKVRVE